MRNQVCPTITEEDLKLTPEQSGVWLFINDNDGQTMVQNDMNYKWKPKR